jgi:amino acid efflux transporter
VYLGVAVVTVSVLGARAATGVPLADLLDIAVGGIGRYLAAAAAVALTLAATNAYLSGAAELAGRLRGAGNDPARRDRSLELAVAGMGLLVLASVGLGLVSLDTLVALPAAMFVTVYAICTAAAVRLTGGASRVVAAIACLVIVVILGFSGWALLAVAAVAAPAVLVANRSSSARGRDGALAHSPGRSRVRPFRIARCVVTATGDLPVLKFVVASLWSTCRLTNRR